MTLSARDPQRSFFDVSFLAENLFGERDPYELFRREILPALEAQREKLGVMYCADNGRPPIDPDNGDSHLLLYAGNRFLLVHQGSPARKSVTK